MWGTRPLIYTEAEDMEIECRGVTAPVSNTLACCVASRRRGTYSPVNALAAQRTVSFLSLGPNGPTAPLTEATTRDERAFTLEDTGLLCRKMATACGPPLWQLRVLCTKRLR